MASTSNPPTIVGTVANQPNDGTIFSATKITDDNQSATDTATIIITDGSSATPTDADGSLSGPGILSKTGTGTYVLGAASPGDLTARLQSLLFSETPVTSLAPGQTITPHFELDVTDTQASLTSKDTTTSLLSESRPPMNPTISGTVAGQEISTAVKPFTGVTLSDPNFNAVDTLTVTIEDSNGTPTDANGTFTLGSHVQQTGRGVYTIVPTDGTMASGIGLRMEGYPAILTGFLDGLIFQPSANAGTTKFVINFNDTTYSLSASDGKTTVTLGDEHRPPIPTDKFQVQSMSSDGKTVLDSWSTNGQPYSGPVPGLTDEYIVPASEISDNLDIVPTVGNVFIHTGNGRDAIDASGVLGNNILDASTNTNYLTGGAGDDEFYVDTRGVNFDIFDTITNVHAGDLVTIWGIASGQNPTFGDNVLPTAPGLDMAWTINGQDINVNVPGYSTADLNNGAISVTFGTSPPSTNPDGSTLAGSDYMQLHFNS